MRQNLAALYRHNPRKGVAALMHEMHELPPDDPKYAKTKKRLEALERYGWSWALFPEVDELAEIDRFTKADVPCAWQLSPLAITQAEWRGFCKQLFHPRRLAQEETTGILPRLAMSTSESREQSLLSLKESLSEFDGMGLDRLRSVAFIKAHCGLLFGYQSPEEGAWDQILDVLDAEHQRQQDEWDAFRKREEEEAREFKEYLEAL